MRRKIVGYHLDEEGHWVADLDCGHPQHVRHQPPWMERPWVTTPEGRRSRIGMELDCKRCDEDAPEPPSGPAAGQQTPRRRRRP